MAVYKKMKDVIRFKKNGKQLLILNGITTEQAQEWCGSEFTKGKDYFDGFDEEGTHCTKQKPKYTHYFIPNKEYN